MGNCLETKLKGIVNNDNLEILGYMGFDIHISDNVQGEMVIGGSNSAFDFYVTGTSGNPVQYDSINNRYLFGSGDYKFHVKCRYIASYINWNTVNPQVNYARIALSDLVYAPSVAYRNIGAYGEVCNVNTILTTFVSYGDEGCVLNGTLQDFAAVMPRLISLWLVDNNYGLYGDISALSIMSDLTQLFFMNSLESSKIYGEIASLAPLTSLTALSLLRSNVGGNIENFVEAQVKTHGRNSGTLGIDARIGQFTLNGNIVTVKGSSSGLQIVYSASTVLVKNGVTNTTIATYNVSTDSWTYGA